MFASVGLEIAWAVASRRCRHVTVVAVGRTMGEAAAAKLRELRRTEVRSMADVLEERGTQKRVN